MKKWMIYLSICLLIVSGITYFSWDRCLSCEENLRQIFLEPQATTRARLGEITYLKNQAELEQLKNCRPEKPLSRGELFSLAMQDYWQRKMKRLYRLDQIQSEYHEYAQEGDTPLPLVARHCQLAYDDCGHPLFVVGHSQCYPRKIKKYPDMIALKERFTEYFDKRNIHYNFEGIADQILAGELYHPDYDPSIYPPESHHQNTDFAVIMRDGNFTDWYSNDCCRLLSFEEMEAEYQQNNDSKQPYFQGDDEQGYFFLRISRYTIDGSVFINHDSQKSTGSLGGGRIDKDPKLLTTYYRVSRCGKLLVYCPDCVF